MSQVNTTFNTTFDLLSPSLLDFPMSEKLDFTVFFFELRFVCRRLVVSAAVCVFEIIVLTAAAVGSHL